MVQFVADVEFQPKKREYKKGPQGPRPRTEEQKPWDAAFQAAMDEDRPLAVQVAPDEADEARSRVGSAARYFGKATTEGQPQSGNVSGTVILTWKIREPQTRKKTSSE